MQCIIPNQNLRILVRGLHSLARIGDELYVEPAKEGISFRTVNSAQSAYSSLFFNQSFFSRYKCNFQSEETGTCKISMRACLRVFKSPNCMDRHVESCKIEIGDECLKLIFQIQFNQGYTKTHFLSVNDNETVQLKYSKTEMKNEVSILPRTLHRAVKYFGLKDEEITFDVTEDKVNLKNYFDNSEVENQKVVRTNFCLHRSDFETYNVNLPSSITFALRELRAVCAFSESSNSVISMHFEVCGKPVIFTVENPLYQADYVVSTLPPEIINGERPYRRSQLSDIASSMPSNSVVNSTKRRRLAPVSEEVAELNASSSTDSNTEQIPNVQVVQVEVHHPQTCTPIVQQNRSQSDVTVVPQVQPSSQNNAAGISQLQRNSQNNTSGVAEIKRSSQNNITSIAETQRNSQNNTSGVSEIQRSSQNNITGVAETQRNSQSNITGIAQMPLNSKNTLSGVSELQRTSQNNVISDSQVQQYSQNNMSLTNITHVQRISQNSVTNVAAVSSRCSFGPSNESDTNLDEMMMRIEVNSEFFQDTHQKTLANGLTGINESQLQKIETIFKYCFNFPAQCDPDDGNNFYENDD